MLRALDRGWHSIEVVIGSEREIKTTPDHR
jgi:hypothetical protein